VLCISNVSGPQSERFKGYLIGIGPKEGHVAVRRDGVGVYTYDDRTRTATALFDDVIAES
jgi:hypothetical protein